MADDTTTPPSAEVPYLHQGRTWQQLPAGMTFRTNARTVTEADLISFVTWAGFTEPLFFDASAHQDAGSKRLVPAAMTYSMAEGLVIQTLSFAGTGIAFLGMELKTRGPVCVGDTIHAIVTVTGSRPTKRPERGLVVSAVTVRNQRGEDVLEYTPQRLVASDVLTPE